MVNATQLFQFVLSGVVVGSIYGIIGIGFNLIYNCTGVINFAQGEFVMLGGMTTIAFYQIFHLSLWVSCILAILLVTTIGIIFERLTIYPIKDFAVLNVIIITMGVSTFLKGGTMILLGHNDKSFPPFTGDNPIYILGATIPSQGMWTLLICILLVLAFSIFSKYSIHGIAMKAVAFNSSAAGLMGVKVRWVILVSFALSAASGAIAGVSITPITLTSYNAGLMLGLKGFCAAIFGGLGNFWGAITGGILLGLFESLGAGLISSGYKDAIAFVVLLVILFLKPTGLIGTVETRED